MALRDTWHRTLVYFGLAEDRYDDEDDYDVPTPPPASRAASTVNAEAEIEERYRERPNVRRMPSRRRRDDFDDIFAEDAGSSRTNVLRAVGPSGTPRQANGRSEVRVHFVSPRTFNDVQDVADKFKDGIPVILNMQDSDNNLRIRLTDFASGLTYALDGGMQRIADKTLLLTPRNVEVSAEERARILEKGFFNQS
jgi:cell division inhibitor SepF